MTATQGADMTDTNYIACHACDLLHCRSDPPVGTTARCTRCGTVLYRRKASSLDGPLALVITAMVLFMIANTYPFLTLKIEGRIQETVLVSGMLALFEKGQTGLAVLVLLTGIILPLIQMAGLIYILLPLRLGVTPPYMAAVYRWVRYIRPWSMTEIFLLGILVASVKLIDMAQLVAGVSLFAFMAFIFVLPAATIGIDSSRIWKRASIQIDR